MAKRVCWKEQEQEKATVQMRGDELKSGGHGGDGVMEGTGSGRGTGSGGDGVVEGTGS